MNRAVAPTISLAGDSIRIEDESLFAPSAETLALAFLRRVLALTDVREATIDPTRSAARLDYSVADDARRPFLEKLARYVGGDGEELDSGSLPDWRYGEPLTVRRHGGLLTTLDLIELAPGCLRLRVGEASTPERARELAAAFADIEGVKAIKVSGDRFRLRYEPQVIGPEALVRRVEAVIGRAARGFPQAAPLAPVRLAVPGAVLGVAALTELALPVAAPVAIGLLVATNLGNVSRAAGQLAAGRIGTPVLHTALLGCSITTGQYVAHALMDWSFQFWESRWRRDYAATARRLADSALPGASEVIRLNPDGVVLRQLLAALRPGQRLRAGEGETIAADGRVLAGLALVSETGQSGARTPVRKLPGDRVHAGSRLLKGSLDVEVTATGGDTRVARIVDCLMQTAAAIPDHPDFAAEAARRADRAVLPSLATAGAGFVLGNLFTVGAILHQDHYSGPRLAVPLATLEDVAGAYRGGAVVMRPTALNRLAESRFIVLDEAFDLATPRLLLREFRTGQPDPGVALGLMAGAALWLGDERAQVLVEQCRLAGGVVRQPELVAVDSAGITCRRGGRSITLTEGVAPGDAGASLVLGVDGVALAEACFDRSGPPRAGDALAALRGMGYEVFLTSCRPDGDVEALVAALGSGLGAGGLDAEGKLRFLEGLRRRGVKPIWLSGPDPDFRAVDLAHVVMIRDGAETVGRGGADVVLLGGALDPLVELLQRAQSRDRRIHAACRGALGPNLLCVAGAFAGILNGTTSGLIANLGVYNAYRRTRRTTGLAPPLGDSADIHFRESG